MNEFALNTVVRAEFDLPPTVHAGDSFLVTQREGDVFVLKNTKTEEVIRIGRHNLHKFQTIMRKAVDAGSR